jgi:hypothetical protein
LRHRPGFSDFPVAASGEDKGFDLLDTMSLFRDEVRLWKLLDAISFFWYKISLFILGISKDHSLKARI